MPWSNRLQFAIAAAALLGGALMIGRALPQPQLTAPPGRSSPAPGPQTQIPPEINRRLPPEFSVMIDPSHGGDDKGAVLAGNRLEKDVTLALARELRRQLEERGIPARLLRDSDVNLSLERRAEAANEERASIYIALHAGPPGSGIRVYAPALANAQPPAVGRFVPWESAQAQSRERSKGAAGAVAAEFRRTGLHVASLTTSLRPLNNLVTPAIAVEWAPGEEEMSSPQIQRLENTLASVIASGVAQVRAQSGARP
jgi:N-acetylmuramoyl-L-alanine amidase